jgi:hypothetical protein
MPNDLKLTGFDELRRDLLVFPTASRDVAAGMIAVACERTKELVQAAYPVITGALRDGVEVMARVGRGIAAVRTVSSTSGHAMFYEFGTRHSRPHPTFVPITQRERRATTQDIAAYVETQGITVTGAND